MTTKKQLEEELEATHKLIRDYRYQEGELGSRIKHLEEDVRKTEDEKINLNLTYKRLKSLVETIVKILAGDSEPKSKSEVITDLLAIKVNEAKEILKQVKEESKNPYRNSHHNEYGDFS